MWQTPERVSFFIDGYNFYCGLNEKYGKKWLWLDYGTLCSSIIGSDQVLASIYFCTARTKGGDMGKWRRQDTYWKALSTVRGLSLHEGYHQKNKKKCWSCRAIVSRHEEKQTDSRIAALFVAEAMADRADTLVIIGGDSDHVPPVEVVREERPEKKMLVCWPPARKSDELAKAVGSEYYISARLIRRSQFPETVTLADGSTVTRPAEWRAEAG